MRPWLRCPAGRQQAAVTSVLCWGWGRLCLFGPAGSGEARGGGREGVSRGSPAAAVAGDSEQRCGRDLKAATYVSSSCRDSSRFRRFVQVTMTSITIVVIVCGEQPPNCLSRTRSRTSLQGRPRTTCQTRTRPLCRGRLPSSAWWRKINSRQIFRRQRECGLEGSRGHDDSAEDEASRVLFLFPRPSPLAANGSAFAGGREEGAAEDGLLVGEVRG